jgi:cytochrome c5
MKCVQFLTTTILTFFCFGACAEDGPRPGVKAEWEPRLAYGVDELYLSAIEGLGPTMPPRGMCNECSDSQLKSVVDYIIKDLK